MPISKSHQLSGQFYQKADELIHEGEKLANKGHGQGGYFVDKGNRYSDAAHYLEKRASRDYGQGHDMSIHGEGKPHKTLTGVPYSERARHSDDYRNKKYGEI